MTTIMTKPLSDALVYITTGVKGGIGKSVTSTLLAHYLAFQKNKEVKIINCDAKIHSIEYAHDEIAGRMISPTGWPITVFADPLADDRTYERIFQRISTVWADWEKAHPDKSIDDLPRFIIDMPGQNEGLQHLDFLQILSQMYSAAILWLMDSDTACLEALANTWLRIKALDSSETLKPTIVVPGLSDASGQPDYKQMDAWHLSALREEMQYKPAQNGQYIDELWIEKIPSNLLQWLKDYDLSIQAVIKKKFTDTRSYEGRTAPKPVPISSFSSIGFKNYMVRFQKNIEQVQGYIYPLTNDWKENILDELADDAELEAMESTNETNNINNNSNEGLDETVENHEENHVFGRPKGKN